MNYIVYIVKVPKYLGNLKLLLKLKVVQIIRVKQFSPKAEIIRDLKKMNISLELQEHFVEERHLQN